MILIGIDPGPGGTDPLDITLDMAIAPMGKGSPRASSFAGHARMRPDAKSAHWEATVREMARQHIGARVLDGPFVVDILAVFPRTKELERVFARPRPTGYGPEKRHKYPLGFIIHTVKPDRDNVEKSCQDALKPFWRDDCEVAFGRTLKVYSEFGGQPRTVIRIRSAKDLGVDAVAAALWPSAVPSSQHQGA